jgi:hypothetical protein
MANFIPTKTDDLRVLLERLFPETRIADTGVALLAAQITNLENRCEAMHSRIDFSARQMVELNVLSSRKINRKKKYGTSVNRESRLVKRESLKALQG